MKDIHQEEAIALIEEGNRLTYEEIVKIREQRLAKMIRYARENSNFYRELYKELPENPRLTDLPIVRKNELTSRMKDWITDPEFSEEELTAYLGSIDNLEQPFMGKYSVSTTSGTTGVPLRMIRDNNHLVINGAMMQVRFYKGEMFKDIPELGRKETKYASIIATGGYHAAYTGFERTKKALAKEGYENVMEAISIVESLEKMVEKLNEFQPEVVTGYPSVLDVLSFEQQAGRLRITPKAILCSAEQLTEPARVRITERFHCPVGNVFCSTEGGEIALLCSQGRMHVNADWIIIEPIDKNGNPAAPGTISEGVLLTNLMNKVQPIIRYFVDDCVMMHDEKCTCGSPLPYMDILGRTDDIPDFRGNKGRIKLSPIVFFNEIVDIKGIAMYQFGQRSLEELVMRVLYSNNVEPEEVNQQITDKIKSVFKTHNLGNVRFEIVKEEPLRAARGHKMRTYIKEFQTGE